MSLSVAATVCSPRLRVPSEHLGILVDPTAAQVRDMLARAGSDNLQNISILDRPLAQWRAQLRRRLNLAGPVVVTGHQPEFFHAGVLAKLIAVWKLATTTGGSAVFLSVDADMPKHGGVIVPQRADDDLRRVEIALPGYDPRQTYEDQADMPQEKWSEFFSRVAMLYEHSDTSLLPAFSEAWLGGGTDEINFCDAISRGRAALEQTLGLDGITELRISQLCDSPEFRAFARHLMLHAPRLAGDYNTALADYRRRHRLRSPLRPVPALATSGELTEVPLWISRSAEPRRRLYVSHVGDMVRVFADRQLVGEFAKADLAAVDAPWRFEAEGWRLRPRALTLSAFARLFLADLFIHGVGGARYDEITDDYLRRFLNVTPPPMCTVSATLHLPLPRTNVSRSDLLAARRQSRDIHFNPQRYITDILAEMLRRRQELIKQSDELFAAGSRDRSTRRQVFDGIRQLNADILKLAPQRASDLAQQARTLEQHWQHDQIATDREYFVALHSKESLEELVTRLSQQLETS
ncbi:MAG: hypothetical protein ABIG44_12305 [Planctomycetota bacterium]